MKIREIYYIFFLFCYLISVDSGNQECYILGNTFLTIYSKSSFEIICNNDFDIIEVGIETCTSVHYPFFLNEKSYGEVESAFTVYFLGFENSTIFLMDVDEMLDSKRIYFLINIMKKVRYTFKTNLLTTVVEEGIPATIEERIKYKRYFTNDIIFEINKWNHICWDEIETKFKLKILHIYFCHEYHRNCDMFKEFNKNTYNHYKGSVFLMNETCLSFKDFDSTISDITISFMFVKNNIQRYFSIKKINIQPPFNITEVTNKYIKWRKGYFFSFFSISKFLTVAIRTVLIGKCVRDKAKLRCNRHYGLSLIIEDFYDNGISINLPSEINLIYLRIDFDAIQNNFERIYFSRIFIKIPIKKELSETYQRPACDFSETFLKIDKDLLTNYGILNTSLDNKLPDCQHYFKQNHFIISDNLVANVLCVNFLYSREETMSIFSFILLECSKYYVSLFDFDQLNLEKILIKLHINLLNNTWISILGEQIDLDNFELKNKKNIDPIKYKRYMRFIPIIKLNYENIIYIPISESIYTIISIGLCRDTINCYHREVDVEYIIYNINGRNFRFENRSLTLYGNPNIFEKFFIILEITDGIDVFSQASEKIHISRKLLIPLLCNPKYISWDFEISQFFFTLILETGEIDYEIGKCSSKTGCSIIKNPFVNHLFLKNMHFSKNLSLKDFTLVFNITPVINGKNLESSVWEKQYILESEECQDSDTREDKTKYQEYFERIRVSSYKIKRTKSIIDYTINEAKRQRLIENIILIIFILVTILCLAIYFAIFYLKKKLFKIRLKSFRISSSIEQ